MRAAGRHPGCGRILGVVLAALGRAGATDAAEEPSFAIGAKTPTLDAYPQSARPTLPWSSVPSNFLVPPFDAAPNFPAGEFRRRGRSLNEVVAPAEPQVAMSRLDTPMGQRLSDYRWHGQIRVLTLWESGANSLSLQAGRHGSPSLQWTSRMTQHGGAPHGVLDHLFAVSVAGAGRAVHPVTHPPAAKITASKDGNPK